MARRNDSTVKAIVLVFFVGILIFSLYSYRDLVNRLQTSEERGGRLTQQHDSLAAQVQVLTEAKSRLERTLQETQDRYTREKQDLQVDKQNFEDKLRREKDELKNRLESLNQQLHMQKGRTEDLEEENLRVKKSFEQLQEDFKQANENHEKEFKELKQEGENIVAPYLDQIADLKRKITKYHEQLGAIRQNIEQKEESEVGQIDNQKVPVKVSPKTKKPEHKESDEDNNGAMQINKPGDDKHPGYHKVKPVVPDHEVQDQDNQEEQLDQQDDDKNIPQVHHMQQVRPPQDDGKRKDTKNADWVDSNKLGRKFRLNEREKRHQPGGAEIPQVAKPKHILEGGINKHVIDRSKDVIDQADQVQFDDQHRAEDKHPGGLAADNIAGLRQNADLDQKGADQQFEEDLLDQRADDGDREDDDGADDQDDGNLPAKDEGNLHNLANVPIQHDGLHANLDIPADPPLQAAGGDVDRSVKKLQGGDGLDNKPLDDQIDHQVGQVNAPVLHQPQEAQQANNDDGGQQPQLPLPQNNNGLGVDKKDDIYEDNQQQEDSDHHWEEDNKKLPPVNVF